MIRVFDNVLTDPAEYRESVLTREFRSFEFGPIVFHGISIAPLHSWMPRYIVQHFPTLNPQLSFFRRSPEGQVEPHFIHTDVDMGDWSAILYLNPNPPAGDGTCFWTHKSGAVSSSVPHERSEEGNTAEGWTLRKRVDAKFGRLLMFSSSEFHSRAIYENCGQGDDARLVQVTFGVGDLAEALKEAA